MNDKELSILCSYPECREVFTSIEKMKAHTKVHTLKGEKRKVQPKLQPKKVAKPIKLEYRYSGQCLDCNRDVDTLTLGLGGKGKQTVVAYCQIHKEIEHKVVGELS